jgi:hypothetical protein
VDSDPDSPDSEPCWVVRLRLLFVWISVAMYELPLPVLAAIDLGHLEIERHKLVLAACLPGSAGSRLNQLACGSPTYPRGFPRRAAIPPAHAGAVSELCLIRRHTELRFIPAISALQ